MTFRFTAGLTHLHRFLKSIFSVLNRHIGPFFERKEARVYNDHFPSSSAGLVIRGPVSPVLTLVCVTSCLAQRRILPPVFFLHSVLISNL
jgi:hypothetical protein